MKYKLHIGFQHEIQGTDSFEHEIQGTDRF